MLISSISKTFDCGKTYYFFQEKAMYFDIFSRKRPGLYLITYMDNFFHSSWPANFNLCMCQQSHPYMEM